MEPGEKKASSNLNKTTVQPISTHLQYGTAAKDKSPTAM